MELHAVHFNTKFGSSMVEALNNSGKAYNTLAVLAVMFDVEEEDNPMLKPIVDGLNFVKHKIFVDNWNKVIIIVATC